MLGIETVKITPLLLKTLCGLDQFKGYWAGLEEHTTSLHLLADVAAYGQEFRSSLAALKDRDLTPDIIQRLHAGLHGEKEPSPFRIKPLVLSENEAAPSLETADPEDVLILTGKLAGWVNEALRQGEIHPLIIAGVFSCVFLQISPFADRNHTLLQLLITIIMLKAGYAYAPYLSLQPLVKARKGEFYEAMKSQQDLLSQEKTDWSAWINFFFSLLAEQQNRLRERLVQDKGVLASTPGLSGKVMDLFRDHRRLQMKEIEKLTGARRSTLKLRLGELVEAGYLRRYGQARSTWYALM
ncbi:MAG: hypothetical protein K9G62_01075 [Alphaproteobacteria bacterium]|nr:hypothetical protein [Alphaproteobacteria bacterium]